MQLQTVKDLENVQAVLNQAGYDYRLELEDGKILVIGPSDIVSSEIDKSLKETRKLTDTKLRSKS